MSNYTRTTRECSFDNLRPELAAAIREHAETYKLGNIESDILICCETTSRQQKKGLFGGSTEVTYVGTLVTSEWLIWATGKEKERTAVASGHLRNIQVQDFEETAMFKVIPDAGINVTGRYSDVTKQGIAFIGLGPEPVAQKFRRILQDALQKAMA
jgi:hypothetical protein